MTIIGMNTYYNVKIINRRLVNYENLVEPYQQWYGYFNEKEVRHCVRQRNNLLTKPTKLLGIERKFKVFMLIRKRGSVFNR